MFVELPGNGDYQDANGDRCSGLPEDCVMGYGLTAGPFRRGYFASRSVSHEQLTIVSTGFRKHSDRWTLRPCAVRSKAREWLEKLPPPR